MEVKEGRLRKLGLLLYFQERRNMDKNFTITMFTKNLFNTMVAIAVHQVDPEPVISDYYDSPDGQLVDISMNCTFRERTIIELVLKDYILKVNKKRDFSWMTKGWC